MLTAIDKGILFETVCGVSQCSEYVRSQEEESHVKESSAVDH